MRCSGEKPACTNCINSNKQHQCVYPAKDRKIMLMESDLDKLHERVSYLEGLLRQKGEQIDAVPLLQQQQHQSLSHTQPNHSLRISSNDTQTTVGNGPPSKSFPVPLTFTSPIQPRSQIKADPGLFNFTLENFLLPDRHNESLQWHLNFWDRPLPPREHTMLLLETVQRRYSLEFYLVDFPEIFHLIDKIYANFHQPTELLKLVNHVSLSYFYVILAFGAQQLTPPVIPKSQIASHSPINIPGIEYYIIASQLFNVAQEELNIHFVQAATLLGLYAANLNRYNTVYNYFGVASRASVAMGLHRQKTYAKVNPTEHDLIEEEKYKRIWWTVFIIDTTWASKMSMPVHIDYTDTDVDLPLDNIYPLNDNFDSVMLELNVHLSKYISKFGRIIYGPKIRTFSVNYINTDQFNQRLLIKNIIDCLKDLIKNLELTILGQYNKSDIVQPQSRRLTNLFLRFFQLISTIVKPLICLMFNKNAGNIVDNNSNEIVQSIFKGIHAACALIDLVYTLYKNNLLFELGFWDGQYVYSAMMLLILSQVNGRQYSHIQKGLVLLKYMAGRGNITAQNSCSNLHQIFTAIKEQPSIAQYFTDVDTNMELTYFEQQEQSRLLNLQQQRQQQATNIDFEKFLKLQHCDEDTMQRAKLEVDNFYKSASIPEILQFQDFFLNNSYLSEPIWKEIQGRIQKHPLVVFPINPNTVNGNSAEVNNTLATQNSMYEIIRKIQNSDDIKWTP